MTGVRRALIVATDEYSDPKLAQLSAPASDARALAEVLQDENVGAFEVETVLNQESHDVRVALARFLKSGKRGDTLLLHFSCHGVKDVSGELYFATTDTDMSLLEETGVPSSRVKLGIDGSRASLVLCLVDCCYSGAFAKGTKAADTNDLIERLGGQGRAVITASTSLQLALDGKESPSLFTRIVVDGLRTGDADLDLDGLVSLDEFYNFVHERVTAENPHQTPVASFEVQGEVYLARRGAPVTTPAALPPKLLETLKFGEDYERQGAVIKLTEFLVEGHPGRAVAARLELERLRDNDVYIPVRVDAARALAEAGAQADVMPEIPTYLPGEVPKNTKQGNDEPSVWQRLWAAVVATRRGVLAAAVVVVAVLLVAAYLVSGPDGNDDLVTLPEDELLLGIDDEDGQHHLVAVNVDTGGSRVVSTGDVYLPTIAHDRRQVAVMLGEAANRPTLAGVDGSDQQPLVGEDSSDCQYSRRPAQSTDGRWAMVCQDDTGGTEGLFVVGEDGMPNELPVSSNVTGAPTWDDDDQVVFVVKDGDGTSLWQISGEGGVPVPLQDVDADSASAPDWSPAGLLYLGIDEAGDTDLYLHDEGGEDRRLTSDGEIEAASWSPDGRRVAFIAPDDADSLSLWVKDVFENARRREIPVDGEPGPPAWSSR